MDYKKLIDECNTRAELYRLQDDKKKFEHEQECARAITILLACAEEAETRAHELETTHRTEICEDGYDCAELGRAGKRVQEAEARAEKAEKCIAEVNTAILLKSKTEALNAIKRWRAEKEE